jgi:hypothetical protein
MIIIAKLIELYLELRLSDEEANGVFYDNEAETLKSCFPLRDKFLHLLIILFALPNRHGGKELENICGLCNRLGLMKCVLFIQQNVLNSRRLAHTPMYVPNVGYPEDFYESEHIIDPRGNEGSYVDVHIIERNGTTALDYVKKVSSISMTLWYLPYLLVIAPVPTVNFCVEQYPTITWMNVNAALTNDSQKFVHSVLGMEFDQDCKNEVVRLHLHYLKVLSDVMRQLRKYTRFTAHYTSVLLDSKEHFAAVQFIHPKNNETVGSNSCCPSATRDSHTEKTGELLRLIDESLQNIIKLYKYDLQEISQLFIDHHYIAGILQFKRLDDTVERYITALLKKGDMKHLINFMKGYKGTGNEWEFLIKTTYEMELSTRTDDVEICCASGEHTETTLCLSTPTAAPYEMCPLEKVGTLLSLFLPQEQCRNIILKLVPYEDRLKSRAVKLMFNRLFIH